MRLFFLLLFLNFFSFYSFANNIDKDELAKIEQTCLQSSPECLAYLEIGLNASVAHSRQWFRFKQLRLFNLFDLQRWELLRQEVNYWLLAENMPTNFAVYVYIYHAKLSAKQSPSEYSFYLTKATNLLSEINTKSFSPLRLVEIANLQIALKNYDQAKQTLKQLEAKFSNREYPVFKQELYANLGHIALKEKSHQEHIKYRKESLDWALKTDNKQQISIAYSNLAWAYQSTKQFKNSEINYKRSIDYSKLAQDDNSIIRSQMRLTQVLHFQGKTAQAKGVFNYLKMTFYDQLTSEYHNELFQEISSYF